MRAAEEELADLPAKRAKQKLEEQELKQKILKQELINKKLERGELGIYTLPDGTELYTYPTASGDRPFPGQTNKEDDLAKALETLSSGFSLQGTQPTALTSQASTTKPTKQSTKRIRVRSPDGKVGTVSSGSLDAAIAQGYVVIE